MEIMNLVMYKICSTFRLKNYHFQKDILEMHSLFTILDMYLFTTWLSIDLIQVQ